MSRPFVPVPLVVALVVLLAACAGPLTLDSLRPDPDGFAFAIDGNTMIDGKEAVVVSRNGSAEATALIAFGANYDDKVLLSTLSTSPGISIFVDGRDLSVDDVELTESASVALTFRASLTADTTNAFVVLTAQGARGSSNRTSGMPKIDINLRLRVN